ncbi:hypothetical protein [Plantibacter sp. YIM 135249]|uniref:hypothetical protein n=1 Tax=Plantibacter sp. YIM 135249 TaxID=3423918 RepID=UPI003D34846B
MPGERRLMTSEEVDQVIALSKDPAYIEGLEAEGRQDRMVEVDNPMRREVRYRRGTEPSACGESA